jgi:hypothetical protein
MSYVAAQARGPQPVGRLTPAEGAAGQAAPPVPAPPAGRVGVVPVLAAVVSRCIGATP